MASSTRWPLVEHLGAVLRQWVALMTGSLLVAAYALLPIIKPDAPGTRYPWNHLPPWAGWALATLALIVAQYLAWREIRNDREELQAEKDARIQELEAGCPRLSACLTHRTGQGLLLLTVS